jgi:LacI family transcriptional regulator
VPEISEGYAARVVYGIEDRMMQEGYFSFVASHWYRADLIEEYPRLLQQRAVEGLIAVDTACQKGLPSGRPRWQRSAKSFATVRNETASLP